MGHGVLSSSSRLSSIHAFGSNSATCFLSSTVYSDTTVPGDNESAFEHVDVPLAKVPLSDSQPSRDASTVAGGFLSHKG